MGKNILAKIIGLPGKVMLDSIAKLVGPSEERKKKDD